MTPLRITSACVCLALILAGAARSPVLAARSPGPDVRGLWVVRTSLASPASITAMVDAARSAGFNTLFVQVRGRGDAYFSSRLEPRGRALAGQPDSFDPLASAVAEGHAAGLKIHAWLNINLVSDAGEVPGDPRHVVNRHPEWLMVPLELAGSIGDPHARGFVSALASWTRAQRGAVEGLFISPIADGAADEVVEVVQDVAARYDVDGVHLDYVRYPGAGFDYSQGALRAFAAVVSPDLSARERQALAHKERSNPLVWTQTYPRRWEEFRRSRLTSLVGRLHDAVARRRPGALLSAAVVPDARAASASRFQDWPGWAARGLVDAVCPMAYATDDGIFRQQLESTRAEAGGRPVWAGIGAYRLTGDQTLRQIQDARASGVDGVILFSYDSLVNAARGSDNLSRIGAQAFGQ